jgi:hypothetical protein
MDALRTILPPGEEAQISIIVSHPGTVEDAFVIGEHSPADIAAIITRLETGPSVEHDTTSTSVGPFEFKEGAIKQ